MAKKQAQRIQHDEPSVAEIIEIKERHKTYRWIAVCVAVIIVAACVTFAVIRIHGSEPGFGTVAIFAISAAIAIWAGPPAYWSAKLKWYMEKDHDRLLNIEMEFDPGRESSGLDKDGTSAHDDL